jgi:predicted DCC family thiol-disulfide oxidoreductase YuxK
MVYDGDCSFCKLWIARWDEETATAVKYEPLQVAATRFPEIPRQEFERAVKLIDSDGQVWSGAAAVYRSFAAGGRPLNRWSYDHVPGFAAASEYAYRFIAQHRELAHRITLLLWGKDVRRPTYVNARAWFLRALGVIYLIAFVSFWVQADGLVGSNGILPLPRFLEAARAQLGENAWRTLPTLCWLNASNSFLHLICAAGLVLSALLIEGMVPILCLILLWLLYLSLTIAGQTFFNFQWDILLLETGFLAIFIAPLRYWTRRGQPAPVSRPALFLLQFLLFKLMFMSGVVKLSSGDASWWNLTALDYHYWTQPLPTLPAWWADKSPAWLKQASTVITLVIEIAIPFLIWFPRRLRLFCCGCLVLLQIMIGVTGNYAFFNLLTLALCLLLVDDVAWPRRGKLIAVTTTARRWPDWIAALVILVTMPLNALLIFGAIRPEAPWPKAVASLYEFIGPFRVVNGYGLFRVMTKERPEIIIQGSEDGINWRPYEFKWKPGPLDRRPGFVAPHQPRLDWQMWFAALGDPRQNPWFFSLAFRLLENSPDVIRLLAKNPFPEKPPHYLRAQIYRYRFATLAQHRETGAWWTRDDERVYLPIVSLGGQ